MSDTSDIAVGGVLQQRVESQWHPVAYFSRKLTPPETRYSTFDRELLAVYLSIRHFRQMVEGREFSVFTDHKPLMRTLSSRRSHSAASPPARFYFTIKYFTSDIQHVKGAHNPVADALSRIEINALDQRQDIHFEEMAKAQEGDQELSNLSSSTSLKVSKVPIPASTVTIVYDLSKGVP